jgi:hypothetical protein
MILHFMIGRFQLNEDAGHSNEPEIEFIFSPTIWSCGVNATFNNISIIRWQSVLLVKETGENHRPVTSH